MGVTSQTREGDQGESLTADFHNLAQRAAQTTPRRQPLIPGTGANPCSPTEGDPELRSLPLTFHLSLPLPDRLRVVRISISNYDKREIVARVAIEQKDDL